MHRAGISTLESSDLARNASFDQVATVPELFESPLADQFRIHPGTRADHPIIRQLYNRLTFLGLDKTI